MGSQSVLSSLAAEIKSSSGSPSPGGRFELQGGMNTMSPTDAMEPGSFPFLQNIRRNQQGRISSRPPLSDTLLGSAVAGTGGITSLIRLNDTTNLTALPAGYVYIMDAAGTLYITTTSIATGLSGNPLGFVTFRPNAAPNPWCYVADPSEAVTIPAYITSGYGLVTGMVKVRSDGTC